MEKERVYAAIDLKSFYASVECVERGYDPLNTNLVVADQSRTDKTICLAVSPALKSFGIPGRPRLFEVIQKVRDINNQRKRENHVSELKKSSIYADQLNKHEDYALDFVVAKPRMAYYIEYSTRIFDIYRKYVSKDDMHIYSIDEVFIDLTPYLRTYNLTAEELTRKMVKDVYETTGITATAGIGTNLYLAKIAMDIIAKHEDADQYGTRLAYLDEKRYRELLWDHKPLTDFWRVGPGIAKRLNEQGLYTMGDIARCSIGKEKEYYNENLLFKIFGVNAELLIDHAWGKENCLIKDIKEYRPKGNSLGIGQVLMRPYTYKEGEIIVKEMGEALALSLVDKNLVTDQVALYIGYDTTSLDNLPEDYLEKMETDYYGRIVPKPGSGSILLSDWTSSFSEIKEGLLEIYKKKVEKNFLIRRVNVTAVRVVNEKKAVSKKTNEQLSLFEEVKEEKKDDKEKDLQKAIVNIKKKYGKNKILKVLDLEEGATQKDRNEQIGGHKS